MSLPGVKAEGERTTISMVFLLLLFSFPSIICMISIILCKHIDQGPMKRPPTLCNSALEFSDENSSRDIHQMCVMVSPRSQPPCLYAFDTSIRSWISKLFPCQFAYRTWYKFRVLLSVIYTFLKQSFNSHNNLTGQGSQVVTFY